jgi:LytS/YehU family sensor histidine kinase
LEVLATVAVITAIVNWRIRIIRKEEQEKNRINQKLADFQMRAIRAQMNPHFIFNAISSIQNYILKSDVYQSYSYLSKFALLIRNVLDNSKEEYITLEKEINSLNLYIELEQLRFKDSFETKIHIDNELDTENTYVPTMFIQPYIENAIWHGLMPKKKDAKLWLSFQQEDDLLKITIKDNGIGRWQSGQHKKGKKHISKGMTLIEERLRSLEIKNNRTYSITVKDLKDDNENPLGTEVFIVIPLLFD